MRKQDGFTMPGTIIFLVLLTSFFVYETNMLLIDKKFYTEIEQKFVLEELLKRSITNIKKDLKKKKRKILFSFHMKRGKREEITFLKTMLFSFHYSVKSSRKFSIK
ncbi:putative comG operon protein 7 [Bacillus anthracis str. Vollum]|uniref:Uncharacterized protein n=1 Tax=Bacillus anthracis TaxID=1392 RepID=A0A0F7RC02_BACAN|nr:hypothetical protein BA_4460 [Bacillus anthracis str. Ames]AAT56439.1 hypothetical protein BAS4139 [Bacillus anthracis str. Sterne]ACP13201.1 comG operon protein 7 [Bacillus anthracis str. CDC 684]AFH85640.1 Hypothetical Protein H9401_4254 [Bacillus anthracis str. H9401]AHE85852.1 competence protein ComG [Bacillus anthracis str. A16R]AHE91717.1 competence protein ComG [Bacillus anthracis str. A16]AIF58411.1 competence protein ComG [Bacillus anthracis]AIK61387.1 putative comG operon protei